jgi:chemotaxis protein methyltransferase CheR
MLAAVQASTAVAPADFAWVCELVRRRSAIAHEPGKEYLVASRLQELALAEGFESSGALVNALRGDPPEALLRRVVEAMLITETHFFRDEHPFEALQRFVFPSLIRARSTARTLRIWSAASSSGQEPYSVAMVLRRHFPLLGDWRVEILASDLSKAMLQRARAGRYSPFEVSRGLSPEYLAAFLRQDGEMWRVSDEIGRMVEFRQISLHETWPGLPPMDVILLRNALMYFDLGTRREILGRLRRVLRPDGFLFLGAAESAASIDQAYRLTRLGQAVCYRLAGE